MANALTKEQQRSIVATYKVPLPEPTAWMDTKAGALSFDKDLLREEVQPLYTADQMHAYSDAENAQFKVLNNALVAANTDLNNAMMAEALSAEGLADAQAMLMTENKALRESVRVLREALQAIKRSAFIDPPYHLQLLHIGQTADAALEKTA